MKFSLLIFALLFSLTASAKVFQKYIGKTGFTGVGNASAVLNNKNRIIVGSRITSASDNDALISCIDAKDSVLWTREIRTSQHDRFMAVTATSDGGCVAAGYVNQSLSGPYWDNQAAVYKFDSSGNILWKQILKSTSHGELFFNVIEIPGSGNISCAGLYDFGNSGLGGGLIVTLSSSGTVIWAKKYFVGSGNEIHDIKYMSGKLICSGFIYSGATNYDGHLFAIKESDGSSVWSKRFDYSSTISSGINGNFMEKLEIVGDKIYVDGYLASAFGTSTCYPSLVVFDTTGLNPIALEYPLSGYTWSNVCHTKVVSASEIYLFQNPSAAKWDKLYCYSPMSNISDVVCTKIKDLANPATSKVYTRGFGNTGNQALVASEVRDGKLIGIGSINSDPLYLIGNQNILTFEADTSLTITPSSCITNISGQLFGNPIVSSANLTFGSITNVSFLSVTDPTVSKTILSLAYPCERPVYITKTDFDPVRTSCYSFSFHDLSASSTGIASWKWDFGDGSSSSLQHPIHTYLAPGTYSVKLIITDSASSKDSITKTIKIEDNFASAGNDTTLCKISGGSTLSLLAKGGVSYKWTPSTGLSNPSIPNPLATITASTSYVVQVTDSFGCIDSDTIHITLEEGFANAGNDTTICLIGGVNTIKLNASGGVNYSWTPAAGLSNPFISNPTATITASTSYIVTVTTAAGCKETDLINITAGDFALTINDTTLCLVSGMAKIPLSASGGINYKWYPATGLSDTTIPNPTATLTTNTLYIVTVEDSFGCIDKDSVQINTSTVTIKATHDTIAACEDVVVTLNASGGLSYDWQPPDGLSNHLIANPKLTVTKNQNYIVTGKNIFGCIDSDTVNIRLRVGVVDVIASPDKATGCNGDEIQLEAKGALNYIWEPKLGLSDEKIPNPKLSITGSRNYVVTGFDADGCKDSDTVSVTGFANPYVKATSIDILADCYKDIKLEASGAISYSWTPAVYAETNFSATTKVYPPATTVFTVRGWDENGCFGEDTITVFYQGKTLVKIPSAFTPNNDQINDKIKPIILCDFTMTEFSIYNRWGNMVFSTSSVSVPWDGTFNGKECELGTYFYILKGKNHKEEEVFFKGDITLIR